MIITSFACVFDGFLFCGPVMAVIGIIIALFPTCAFALWFKKKFKWCKKSCACKTCHDKK